MIRVRAKKLYDADPERGIVNLTRSYLERTGLACKELYMEQREKDYVNSMKYRLSPDNGKTFGEWIPFENEKLSEMYGEDEMTYTDTPRIYNSVHDHYVYTHFTRYFLEGHTESYRKLWKEGQCTFFDHQYIPIAESENADPVRCDLIRYEEGADFDPRNPRNPDFLEKNRGYLNAPIVLRNGDIAVPVGLPVQKACEMAGLDINEIFPSGPLRHNAVIVARGTFNSEKGAYDFTFSNPVILDDLRSSRGIDEPVVEELTSGKLLLVMRGSNVQREVWNTRIAKGTPAYKWFSVSEDGGKHFSEAAPWRFDTGEPVYSAATISVMIRSGKTGDFYWIGNVSDETAYDNFPRYPLHICQVDDRTGLLIKDTLTEIDTRHEGETDHVQLSNFTVYEDRETEDLVVTLAKVDQFDKTNHYNGETWQYTIEVS